MAKPGIRIIEETIGSGPEVGTSDEVEVCFDIQLNRGDFLARDEWLTLSLADRDIVLGFRYGIEGMRVGGTRRFKASPHLCYRDKDVENLPKNAVLVVSIKECRLVRHRSNSR